MGLKAVERDDDEDPRSVSLATVARRRLLEDMLNVAGKDDKKWSVLILDAVTVKVFSSVCKIGDVVDYNIARGIIASAVVEDLNKNRQPMDTTGLYFLSPCAASVARLIFDFGSQPMYRTAHVFFSGSLAPELLAELRSTPGLSSYLATLREAHLEFSVVDRRTFHTNQERALQHLFGDDTAGHADSYLAEVQTAANRVVSLLVSLQEVPAIRFRAAKPNADDPVLEARALVAQRVAIEIHDRVLALQKVGVLPATAGDTCDLLVIDRGFDVVAPVIHEWTYEAMVADQLQPLNGLFRYDVQTQEGKLEPREHVLGEADALWSKLRHAHFAAASLAITAQLDHFRSVNKAASYQSQAASAVGGDDSGELDAKAMRRLVNALPQYREQLAKLAVHVEMASRLSGAIERGHLAEVGALEQALVYGDAGSKELITLLTGPLASQLLPTDKLRLLVTFAATNPEHMDAAKQVQWQKLSKLPQRDFGTIANLEMLGLSLRAKSVAASLLGGGKKRRRPIRKERELDETVQQFTLQRFVPLLADVLEDLAAGKLSADEYCHVSTPKFAAKAEGADATAGKGIKAASVRSNRSTAPLVRKALSSGMASGMKLPPKAKRIIVFIPGGITHSEMRVAHSLSKKLGRDILLGGTSVNCPASFLEHLHQLSSLDDIAKERK